MARHTRRGLLAGVTATAALAAVSLGMGGAATSQAAEPEGVDYVSLGDSYSAGSAILPLASGAPVICAQSAKNYPHLLASSLGLNLKDVSCALAETKHLTTSQYPGVAPQLDAVGSGTDLITLNLGGNDGNVFVGSLLACGSAGLGTGGKGSPCKDKHGTEFDDKLEKNTYPALKASLEKIRAKAPDAEVVAVGYPWILPERAVAGCFAKLPIAEGDVPYMRALQAHLNEVVERAARETGTHFADLSEASQDHDACRPAGTRWVEPVLFGTNIVPVHPNAAGEAGMAAQVRTVIERSQVG
ncbi:SGNH/GDSL hydrolase family protein [Streptomyces sp. NA04227]|uniref:SGNH/GDSL hydrolase family protein n=1 Tax=Streptomyces sp. NA04227 TaxID=2742136 RepID=UPI001591E2C9|nr:SGNH/GDSL hydrolase family protein [Streptomyces sp. NA04227]QKW06793.1 SGNH/GDSL hydrolase family protein [Streptomyces sp. NA04227]